jgi:hypothetical protein
MPHIFIPSIVSQLFFGTMGYVVIELRPLAKRFKQASVS